MRSRACFTATSQQVAFSASFAKVKAFKAFFLQATHIFCVAEQKRGMNLLLQFRKCKEIA